MLLRCVGVVLLYERLYFMFIFFGAIETVAAFDIFSMIITKMPLEVKFNETLANFDFMS